MAKLKYSFDEYIANPSGKGSAVNSMGSNNRDIYEKELMALEGKNGKSKFTVYRHIKTGNKHVYLIHFEIPSSTKGFYNDVVIEFTQDDNDTGAIKTIKKYYVKFFANDSSFIYTYAYTYKSHGVMIPELEKKLPLRCLMQKPTTRNPDNAMGYHKAIYFAYLIMNREQLFEKETLNRIAVAGGLTKLVGNIKSYDQKQMERSKIEKEAREKGRNPKEPTSKIVKSKGLLGDAVDQLKPKITKIVGTTKKTSTVKKVKKK